MIRLFVAIDIPPAIRSLLHGMARQLQGARPVTQDQLHLTLKFIGDVEADRLPSLTKALATVQSPPFPLALRGVGHFPPRGMPRIVWAGITPRPELNLLHARIDEILATTGVARETRPFSPHATLARLKIADPQTIRHFLAKYQTFETEPFQIESFQLYSSRLTSAGAIHRVEIVCGLER